MRTNAGGKIFRIVGFALMVIILLSLAACGTSERIYEPDDEDDPTPRATKIPEEDAPAKPSPDGQSTDADAMFAIVLGEPAGMGEPAGVLNGYFPEAGDSNYCFSLIPMRDELQISIETIYIHDMHFSERPYMTMEEITASQGEYYRVNAYLKPQPDLYVCVRIVAWDGDKQGTFLVDPVKHGDSGIFFVSAGKTPDGLDDSKMQLLSGMAAGAVWQYGQELGWVDDIAMSETPITPEQLALSQESYQNTLRYIIEINDYGHLEAPYYSAKAGQYAAALFPGVNISELPKSDALIGRGKHLFEWREETEILMTAMSADAKTGYVIVGISYENANGAFEDAYCVMWEAVEPFDVYRPFQYKLVGVQPMMRYLLGGPAYDEYVANYLGAPADAAITQWGVTGSPEYIVKPGTWGFEDTILLKTICTDGSVVYILLEDNGELITYLGAGAPDTGEPVDTATTGVYVGDGWSDLGIITIPSNWDYDIHYSEYVIFGESNSSTFMLFAGFLGADSIESAVESSLSSEPFVFNDGEVGYMLQFEDEICWLRNDWMLLNLYHFGDKSIYENNRDLILKIAGSLTVE